MSYEGDEDRTLLPACRTEAPQLNAGKLTIRATGIRKCRQIAPTVIEWIVCLCHLKASLFYMRRPESMNNTFIKFPFMGEKLVDHRCRRLLWMENNKGSRDSPHLHRGKRGSQSETYCIYIRCLTEREYIIKLKRTPIAIHKYFFFPSENLPGIPSLM